MNDRLLETLDRLAKYYDDAWMTQRRDIDNKTRQALQDAAAEIRKYQQAGERLMRPRRRETVYD